MLSRLEEGEKEKDRYQQDSKSADLESTPSSNCEASEIGPPVEVNQILELQVDGVLLVVGSDGYKRLESGREERVDGRASDCVKTKRFD